MATFRFVHAADLHLDTPFEGIAAATPHVAASLRDASLTAWDALIDLCIAEQAAFLLLAGDVYDGSQRGVRAQLRLLAGLERLAEQGIMAFVVHGNHDPVGEGWSAIRAWPENVTVFGSAQVTSAPAIRGGRQLASIHGISYPRADCEENLADRFAAGDSATTESQGLQIGLLHCNAIATGDHTAYSPCSASDLQRASIDYWALGHVHRRQNVLEGPVWASYPGNLQGRSPKPSEMGAKGALVVDVIDDRVRNVRFAACDRIRFHAVQVDISRHADLASVRDALTTAASAAHRAAEGRGLLVRGLLVGRGIVHRDLAPSDALPDLLESLRESTPAGPPLLWWESLRDTTAAAIDRDAIAARGDFSAELLVRAASLRDDPQAISRLLGTPPAELRRRAAGHLEIDAEQALGLLDAAETQALDLLETGD